MMFYLLKKIPLMVNNISNIPTYFELDRFGKKILNEWEIFWIVIKMKIISFIIKFFSVNIIMISALLMCSWKQVYKFAWVLNGLFPYFK